MKQLAMESATLSAYCEVVNFISSYSSNWYERMAVSWKNSIVFGLNKVISIFLGFFEISTEGVFCSNERRKKLSEIKSIF